MCRRARSERQSLQAEAAPLFDMFSEAKTIGSFQNVVVWLCFALRRPIIDSDPFSTELVFARHGLRKNSLS